MRQVLQSVAKRLLPIIFLIVFAGTGFGQVTLILDGTIAALVNALGNDTEKYIGNGSWENIPATKMEFYLDPTDPAYGLGAFTISDIARFSYYAKNTATTPTVEFYVNLYTQPFTGGDATWYGHRLTAEPLYANNRSAPGNVWTLWTTASGTNELTFFDSNHGPAGFYGGPVLGDVQAGPITWSSYVTGGDSSPIDYSGETVKFVVFATSTGTTAWDAFKGYIDAFELVLKNGKSVLLNLEGDHPIPVELTSFSATVGENGVVLTWSTASETENLGFQLFRASTQNGDYAQITSNMIAGAGNSAQAHEYSFVDADVETGKTYFYKLADIDFNGVITFHGPISVFVEALPSEYALSQNYPNPFNPGTTIRFSLPEAGRITLKIYNSTGQLARTLIEADYPAGNHHIYWDGTDARGRRVASGLYVYQLEAGAYASKRKMTLSK